MNREGHQVARLSSHASKVLLRVALTRRREVVLTEEEFASLSKAGLNLIVAREVKGVDNVPLVHEALSTVPDELVLDKQAGGVHEQVSVVRQASDPNPLELCTAADESGIRAEKKAALTRVWEEAFPPDQFDYEYSPLSDTFADWLTKNNRSAEWVGELIQRIGEKWRGQHLKYPVSYVRVAVEGEERKRMQTPINVVDEEDEVDMGLMAIMAKAAKEQYGQDKNNR